MRAVEDRDALIDNELTGAERSGAAADILDRHPTAQTAYKSVSMRPVAAGDHRDPCHGGRGQNPSPTSGTGSLHRESTVNDSPCYTC